MNHQEEEKINMKRKKKNEEEEEEEKKCVYRGASVRQRPSDFSSNSCVFAEARVFSASFLHLCERIHQW